ncbi:hypothetical protein PV326_013681 [Microctonus aethiopoides]|nr:hypothetical protein PV326_013681 [Microctonus aethiopoides]
MEHNFTMVLKRLASSASGRRLKAELYYVREGVVNAYAMTFVVLVPANMADLEFSWESLAGIPRLCSEANAYTRVIFVLNLGEEEGEERAKRNSTQQISGLL